MFEFDRAKMPQVIKNEPVTTEDGITHITYTSGPWHFNIGHPGDLDQDHAEATIYAFAAWLEFLQENNL
jgi:hypothetical protein